MRRIISFCVVMAALSMTGSWRKGNVLHQHLMVPLYLNACARMQKFLLTIIAEAVSKVLEGLCRDWFLTNFSITWMKKARCCCRFDYGDKFWMIKYKQFTCTCSSPKCRYSKDTIAATIEEYNRREQEEEEADMSSTSWCRRNETPCEVSDNVRTNDSVESATVVCDCEVEYWKQRDRLQKVFCCHT